MFENEYVNWSFVHFVVKFVVHGNIVKYSKLVSSNQTI